ncbi:hypothetical protein Ahy_B01g056764 [Arachis hypogaea]|uniref:FAR1 domain-containing protein n=1 Tax=Arachis hypogaea TaxID=3818 RepID=A0A445AZL2_ARAHY|nr:hypothetical protein Ahy_B01g056764 [Arachis hypogaea]
MALEASNRAKEEISRYELTTSTNSKTTTDEFLKCRKIWKICHISEENECYTEEKNENGYDKTTDGKEAAILSANDFLNQQCVSYEEAYQCYVRYAKCVGFGVRKGDAAADSIGNYVRRKFLCNRAGVREKKCYATTSKIRKQKPETRTNCNAMLSIYLDKSCSMWKVRKIVEDHNHPLILLKLVHQISNYCTMIDADKAQNEIVAEFKIINGEYVPTTGLYSLERCAASVYTREIFWKILEEIKSVAALDIVWFGSRSTTSEYKIIKYGRPDHE